MAAILDAILDFSKRSRVTQCHPADSERGPFQTIEIIYQKNYIQNFQVSRKNPLSLPDYLLFLLNLLSVANVRNLPITSKS